jgi:two-component system sensor histidine kinase RpfC
MPVVSGLDVLKQARFMQSGHAPTPLIVLSADATPETIQACRQAGAHAFLSKPIANSILLDTLAGVADASTFADQSAAMPLTPPVRATPAEIAIISEPLLEDLDDQFGAEFLKLFVKECMRDAYRLISKLEETGSVEAWEEFRDCCHALKGVASNIGAEQLVDSAAATMKLGTFDLPTQWRRRVIRLREQFQSARQALVQRLALPDERDGNVDSLS